METPYSSALSFFLTIIGTLIIVLGCHAVIEFVRGETVVVECSRSEMDCKVAEEGKNERYIFYWTP